MTMHSPHPDTHEHGLADDCPRCAEHAEDPVLTLDDGNLRRIVRLAVDRDRFANALTHTDLVAAAKVLNTLERAGHISRCAPVELLEFLQRYGIFVAETDHIDSDREPTDHELANRPGVEGGIGYSLVDDSPGSLGENDWRL